MSIIMCAHDVFVIACVECRSHVARHVNDDCSPMRDSLMRSGNILTCTLFAFTFTALTMSMTLRTRLDMGPRGDDEVGQPGNLEILCEARKLRLECTIIV